MRRSILAGCAVAALIAAAVAASASQTLTYKYDARGRLISVTTNGAGNNAVANYSYDKADNRTFKNVTGAP